MGGGDTYSYKTHVDSTLRARSAGYASTFMHTADITSGKVAASVHKDLDPKGINKSVTGFRESRDCAETPESIAVFVCIDVTGSMSQVPKELFEKLPTLMAVFAKHGAPKYPQICFSAVGDAYCDQAPFQIGQFESSNQMESDLSKFYLEGGGGGNDHESYDLPIYTLARKTAIDCFEKRGQKGYAFIVCDENPPSCISKEDAKDVFEDTLQDDVSMETIVKEATEKWNVFIIRPKATSHGSDRNVSVRWEKLLPQGVIEIEKTGDIINAIALKIAAMEGADLEGIEADLKASGASASSLAVIKNSIKDISPKTKSTKAVTVGKKVAVGGGTKVGRL